MQNEIEVKRLAEPELKDKEWSGHVKIWWTSADCAASEEVADFPYGADEEELEAAVRDFWTQVEEWVDEEELAGYRAGTISAEEDRVTVW